MIIRNCLISKFSLKNPIILPKFSNRNLSNAKIQIIKLHKTQINPTLFTRNLSLSSFLLASESENLSDDSNFDGNLDSGWEIPEPPTLSVDIPPLDTQAVAEVAEKVASGTIKLADYGIGAFYTPSGLIQNTLNFMHNLDLSYFTDSGHLPWWACIALSTLILRSITFKFMLSAQRGMMHQAKYQKENLQYQLRVKRAQESGDANKTKEEFIAMNQFFKEKNLRPISTMSSFIVNIFVLTSNFFALRGMTSAHLPGLDTEGLAWFTDLTVADPTLILPIANAIFLFMIIQTGVEGIKSDSPMSVPFMKTYLKLTPAILLLVTTQMPAGLVFYWVCSNIFSLTWALTLYISSKTNYNLRAKLGIEMPELSPKDQEEIKRLNRELGGIFGAMQNMHDNNTKVMEVLKQRKELKQKMKDMKKKK